MSFFLILWSLIMQLQAIDTGQPARISHKPLHFIKTKLHFPPQAGPELKGKPIGDFILPFQEKIIKSALDRDGNFNKSTVFTGYSRKISKSLVYSLIFLYLLENKEGLALVNMASTHGQSSVVFDQIRNLIAHSPLGLKSKYLLRREWLENKETNTKLQRVYNSPDANLGLQPAALIADELSAMADKKNIQSIVTGMSLAPGGGLKLYASNPPESEHWSTDFVDGLRTDDDSKVFDFSAPPESDISKPESWSAANPFVKHYVESKDKIYEGIYHWYRKEAQKACLSKTAELEFRKYALGQRVAMSAYKLCQSDQLKIADESIYQDKSLRVACGFDLSFRSDYTAASVVLFNEDTETFFIKPFLFLANLQNRYPSQRSLFKSWSEQNLIYLFNKPEINRHFVFKTIKDFLKEKNIKPEMFTADVALSKQWKLDEHFKPITLEWQSPRNVTGAIRFLEKSISSGKVFLIGESAPARWHFECSLVARKSMGFCSVYRSSVHHSIDLVDATVTAVKFLSETKRKKFNYFIT